MKLSMLILALTTRCNLKCRYCYEGDGLPPLDMDDEVLLRALELAAAGGGPCHVQMTGGEPTLVPERIEALASLIHRRGWPFTLAIQTNGTRLTPELVRLFKAHRIQVGVSVDGPPGVQEELRGGSDATLKGLRLLDELGVPFRVTTVVSVANVDYLHQLVLFLACFRYARGIGLDLLVQKGRAVDSGRVSPVGVAALRTGVARMISVLESVNERRALPLRLRELDLLKRRKDRPGFSPFCAAAGGESMAVHPDGRLFPCGQTFGDMRFAAGTVNQPDVERLGVFRKAPLRADQCRGCRLQRFCPGDCPSRLHYNDSLKDGLVCELYRTLWDSSKALPDDGF